MKNVAYWMFVALGLTIGCVSAQEGGTESVAEAEESATEATGAPEAAAESAPEVKPKAKLPVALVAFGDVDDGLMASAQEWASHNLALPVPLLPTEYRFQVDTFEDVLAAAEKMIEDNRLGLVVIWRPATGALQNHGAVFPEKRIAIANLNPMLTTDTDPLIIQGRVERQAIRGICMVMGLEPSPNPMSAMFNYSNLAELDAIGRNLDLPWLLRLQERMVENGIELTPDSPYNLMQ